MTLNILSVFGTRPEAIKMAPVVHALAAQTERFQSLVCVTAQHRQMLDQVLTRFNLKPDADLDLMQPGQDLFDITTGVLSQLKPVLMDLKPDMVLVHGDTTTSMAATLAAYYLKIPVGHVEAGLRTFNPYYPFPEEINRVITDQIAALCFAPTTLSEQNLLKSGLSADKICITGNTVVDALQWMLAQPEQTPSPVQLAPGQRLMMATVHRRENFGEPLEGICQAFLTLVEQHTDTLLALPVHPNPNVKSTVERILGNHPRIKLLPPLDYEPFSRLMAQSTLILTDSGGVQEEAPALGKPVLVLRNETERPEGVATGVVKLVGPNPEQILMEASRLLNDSDAYAAMAKAVNPYGDGQASQRITQAIAQYFDHTDAMNAIPQHV
ncbi:MAG: UDP-N-acetylglucosamine 2-epimerase (non-hydrolyzing) [Vampirovibrionales bacterium]|nr:UDP-N-acetylglucosamine 2-epimerase (non-hydrolyzing) [Vampirovibrionales bacterium]